MNNGREVKKVAIPYYRFSLPNRKSVLVDAFFLKSVRVPARVALLIYPGDMSASPTGEEMVLHPNYTPMEALRYLIKALEWSVRVRYELMFPKFKKIRLSLIFPSTWFRSGDSLVKIGKEDVLINDVELNAAISLLKGVLKGVDQSLQNVKYEGTNYMSLSIVGNCSRIHEIIGPSINMSRSYRWLFKADSGFKEKMSELINDLFMCGSPY